MTIPAKLQAIADRAGYHLEFRPTIRVRGWPQKSEKPYALFHADWSHIASFKTLDALERNLRNRAGC
jgi:hypothetical protein